MAHTLLHYTECGLSNIYLRNGYECRTTDYGEAITIHDLDGLHKVIGLSLVENKPQLDGEEVKFLRKELDLPQSDMAQFLGVSESSIRAWENDRSEISEPAERILRLIYREHIAGDGSVRGIIEHISKLDRDIHEEKLEFEESSEGWRTAA
jgi:DNA-binding transcriptional regulator YiaG